MSPAADPINVGTRFLSVTRSPGVLTVRIDRTKKRNAITQDMYRGLKRACVIADDDPEIDILVLTGSDDVFAVGGDMTGEMEDPEGLGQEIDPTDHFPFRHMERCRKVVVSAVNGLCHAGGLNLVLSSDFAIASERARFRVPELLRGVPDPWVAARLPAWVGVAAAKRLLLTGEEIDASTASTLALVSQIVPHEDLKSAIAQLCLWIRQTAPGARAAVKNDMNRRLPPIDIELFRRSILSPEMTEGFQAFLERRQPRWPRS